MHSALGGSDFGCTLSMSDFKDQFEQSKNDNVVIPLKEKRAQWIAQLLKIEKEGPKTSDDYNMKKKKKIWNSQICEVYL